MSLPFNLMFYIISPGPNLFGLGEKYTMPLQILPHVLWSFVIVVVVCNSCTIVICNNFAVLVCNTRSHNGMALGNTYRNVSELCRHL